MNKPQQILHQHFGYSIFRGQQQEIINHVLAGHSALVLMPTGAGKSLCYQIPALAKKGTALVISPLIALMQDQVAALKHRGIAAECLTAWQTPEEFEAVVSQLISHHLKLLYISPERLVQPRTLDWLDQLNAQAQLSLFAIDEAHCISEWGFEFRPEYRSLSLLAQRYPTVPRLALTATADLATRTDIAQQLGLESERWLISSFDRPNLRLSVQTGHHQPRQLMHFIQRHPGQSGIFYCRTRAGTEVLAQWLNQQGFETLAYHAGLEAAVRSAHQRRFVEEPGLVVAATIAFGMGIDKADVRFVGHLNCPRSLEAYYQEIGRSGRDGKPAEALMLLNPEEVQQLQALCRSPEETDNREFTRMRAMAAYCLSDKCRRHFLLNHFGEDAQAECQGCDNCQPQYQEWTGQESRISPITFADDAVSAEEHRD
jgi:ATP-dependent DNA helicase RecQ